MYSLNFWCPHCLCSPQSIRLYCYSQGCPQLVSPFLKIGCLLQNYCTADNCTWKNYLNCYKAFLDYSYQVYGSYLNNWYEINVAKQYQIFIEHMMKENEKKTPMEKKVECSPTCSIESIARYTVHKPKNSKKRNVIKKTQITQTYENIDVDNEIAKNITYDIIFPNKTGSKHKILTKHTNNLCPCSFKRNKHKCTNMDLLSPRKLKINDSNISRTLPCESLNDITIYSENKIGITPSRNCKSLNSIPSRMERINTNTSLYRELMEIKTTLHNLQQFLKYKEIKKKQPCHNKIDNWPVTKNSSSYKLNHYNVSGSTENNRYNKEKLNFKDYMSIENTKKLKYLDAPCGCIKHFHNNKYFESECDSYDFNFKISDSCTYCDEYDNKSSVKLSNQNLKKTKLKTSSDYNENECVCRECQKKNCFNELIPQNCGKESFSMLNINIGRTNINDDNCNKFKKKQKNFKKNKICPTINVSAVCPDIKNKPYCKECEKKPNTNISKSKTRFCTITPANSVCTNIDNEFDKVCINAPKLESRDWFTEDIAEYKSMKEKIVNDLKNHCDWSEYCKRPNCENVSKNKTVKGNMCPNLDISVLLNDSKNKCSCEEFEKPSCYEIISKYNTTGDTCPEFQPKTPLKYTKNICDNRRFDDGPVYKSVSVDSIMTEKTSEFRPNVLSNIAHNKCKCTKFQTEPTYKNISENKFVKKKLYFDFDPKSIPSDKNEYDSGDINKKLFSNNTLKSNLDKNIRECEQFEKNSYKKILDYKLADNKICPDFQNNVLTNEDKCYKILPQFHSRDTISCPKLHSNKYSSEVKNRFDCKESEKKSCFKNKSKHNIAQESTSPPFKNIITNIVPCDIENTCTHDENEKKWYENDLKFNEIKAKFYSEYQNEDVQCDIEKVSDYFQKYNSVYKKFYNTNKSECNEEICSQKNISNCNSVEQKLSADSYSDFLSYEVKNECNPEEIIYYKNTSTLTENKKPLSAKYQSNVSSNSKNKYQCYEDNSCLKNISQYNSSKKKKLYPKYPQNCLDINNCPKKYSKSTLTIECFLPKTPNSIMKPTKKDLNEHYRGGADTYCPNINISKNVLINEKCYTDNIPCVDNKNTNQISENVCSSLCNSKINFEEKDLRSEYHSNLQTKLEKSYNNINNHVDNTNIKQSACDKSISSTDIIVHHIHDNNFSINTDNIKSDSNICSEVSDKSKCINVSTMLISPKNSNIQFHVFDEIQMKSSQTFFVNSSIRKCADVNVPYPKTDFSVCVYNES